MAEFGLLEGLSADMGYDKRINDLRYHEQQNQRALAENSAKQAIFADDLQYQNAANAHDHKIIQDYAQNKIKEIGSFVAHNPDWETNLDKRIQLDAMKKSLKDNEHVIRGVASDTAYKNYLNDLKEVSKNPNSHDTEAYQDIANQWNNYLQHGNQDGAEAAAKEGKKAFLYTKPQDFIDKNDTFKKVGSAMQANGIQYLNNGRDGAYQTYAKDDELKNEALAIYTSHKRQFDQEYTKKGLDPLKEIANSIRPYVKTDFKIGEKNKLGEEMALAKYKHGLDNAISTGASPYKISILNTDYAKPPAEDLASTFGSRIAHTLPAGKDGKPIDNTGDIFNYDGDIHDKGYRKDGKYQKNGIKTVHGYVYKPLDFGKDVGYTKDPWGFGTDEVLPEYKDVVSIVDSPMDKDGKTQKMLKIKTTADVNANDPSYQGKWDKNISTTKQREAYGINESQVNTQVYEDEAGNKFVLDGNGNPVPYK